MNLLVEKAVNLINQLYCKGPSVIPSEEAGDLERRVDRIYSEVGEAERGYLDRYAACLVEGSSPRLADMLASRQAPALMTDAVFMQGHPEARKYMPSLARFPGDPEAFVSGRGDIDRVLRERGWGAEGAVNRKPRESVPKREAALPKVKPFRQRLRENLAEGGYQTTLDNQGRVQIKNAD